MYLFFCLQRRFRFWILVTFGRSARLKFKLLVDKYKIKGQNSSKLFLNDKDWTSGNSLSSQEGSNEQQVSQLDVKVEVLYFYVSIN